SGAMDGEEQRLVGAAEEDQCILALRSEPYFSPFGVCSSDLVVSGVSPSPRMAGRDSGVSSGSASAFWISALRLSPVMRPEPAVAPGRGAGLGSASRWGAWAARDMGAR